MRAPAKIAQGSQPVPTVSAAPLDDDDTQVVDEAEIAALHAEKSDARDG